MLKYLVLLCLCCCLETKRVNPAVEDKPIRALGWRNMSRQGLCFSLRLPLACRDNVYARGQESIHFSSWSWRWSFSGEETRKEISTHVLATATGTAAWSRDTVALWDRMCLGEMMCLWREMTAAVATKKMHELPYHRIFQWLVTKITSKSIHPEQISNWCTDIPCSSLAMLFLHHGLQDSASLMWL